MKVHRSTLLITCIISILSLCLIIILPTNSRLFQIALAFLGSSFISFMLEIPNYLSLKHDYANRLYFSLFELKGNINILINIIENEMEKNQTISEMFYSDLLNKINISTNNIRNFDANYYIANKRKEQLLKSLSNLYTAFNNLSNSTSVYRIDYCNIKINIIQAEQRDRNLTTEDIKDSLQQILYCCNSFLEIIEENIQFILPNNKQNNWKSDNSIFINNNCNQKISQKSKNN